LKLPDGWEERVCLPWTQRCEHCGTFQRPRVALWYREEILLPNVVGQESPSCNWFLCERCVDQLEALTALAVLAGDGCA
jgi:hypothetical protein